MHIIRLLLLAFFWAVPLSATDNGYTTDVTWDPNSLVVNGERVFIFSGVWPFKFFLANCGTPNLIVGVSLRTLACA